MASPRRSGLVAAVAAIAAIAMGIAIVVGWKTVRHDFFPRNFGVVEEGRIYRSGRLTPRSMRRLIREHGIRTIVDRGAYDTRPEMGETSQEIAAAYRSGSWVPGAEPVEARPGAPVDARRGALPDSAGPRAR